ncbi:hypothetical protein PR202_ga15008 [Eleusine coracana subsp. coracana]|uniref:Uncharacterized protein n=1 Tax=Eleusine coracana subsp. coracana TaxID=191504 RepID=A0AAV5CJ27_ELECO|nr:hypothetical protein PR202_ga15008 [Eleusine coracana subsp. coracana]
MLTAQIQSIADVESLVGSVVREERGQVGIYAPSSGGGAAARRLEEEQQRVVRRRSKGATRGRAEAAVTEEGAGGGVGPRRRDATHRTKRDGEERAGASLRRSGGGAGPRRSSSGSGLRRSRAGTARGGVVVFCRQKNGAKIVVKRNERDWDPNFFPCFS